MQAPLPCVLAPFISSPFTGELYHFYGLHCLRVGAQLSARAAVYAPDVDWVALVGDFNDWNPSAHPMRPFCNKQIWEVEVDSVVVGQCYKFLLSKNGREWFKADPFARQSQLRPNDASVVVGATPYAWRDSLWQSAIATKPPPSTSALLIFEVHLASWRKRDQSFYNYRELAHELAEYVTQMRFTHIELLPITEHLVDESMGYQVTGYFCPTSRHGTANDLKYFVDVMHQHQIGVILDWVPAHFSCDEAGLAFFNGEALYEPEKFPQRSNWGTHAFNYESDWVRQFLIANALFWLDEFHFDGLRVDAVSALLYKDFLRSEDEWEPNADGSSLHHAAIDFIKSLTRECKRRFPQCLLIAEESTAWHGVTGRLDSNGLGFDYAWNLGWINDTKKFFSLPDSEIYAHRHLITFSAVYLFNERYIHSLSHDELGVAVSGLNSLAPITLPDNLRRKKIALFLFYLYVLPGDKLLLAGSDMGLLEGWSPLDSLAHDRVDVEFQTMIRHLNALNQDGDFNQSNANSSLFSWRDCFEVNDYCVSFTRRSSKKDFYIFINFSSVPQDYPVPDVGNLQLVLGTMDDKFPDFLANQCSFILPPCSGAIYVKD